MNNMKYRPKYLSNISRQKGWTFWSLMFVLGIIVLFSYIGLQLFPVYTANNNVKSAMKLAVDNIESSSFKNSEIVRTMKDKLYLDGSHELIDYNEDLVIKRDNGELLVKVTYERRVHLFFNLSLVANFENEERRDL